MATVKGETTLTISTPRICPDNGVHISWHQGVECSATSFRRCRAARNVHDPQRHDRHGRRDVVRSDRSDIERLLAAHRDQIDLARVRSLVAEFAAVMDAPERVDEFEWLLRRVSR
jgi:hypothetical protein